jgi:hypothetical protein
MQDAEDMKDTPMICLCGPALDLAQIPTAKVGDRVKVTFEGTICKTEEEMEDGKTEKCVSVELDALTASLRPVMKSMDAMAQGFYPAGKE